MEQDAACGNVSGFGEMLMGIACPNGNGKLEREANRVSEITYLCTSAHTHALYTAFDAAQSYFGIFVFYLLSLYSLEILWDMGHAHEVD